MPHKRDKEKRELKKQARRVQPTVEKLLRRWTQGTKVQCTHEEVKEAIYFLRKVIEIEESELTGKEAKR